MSYIGRGLQSGAFRQLDDISSGFDGSDTTHTMQVNSTNVTVGDVNQILLSLGGVIQKPGTDFTVSSSTLTFTTAPAANTSFFAILLGSDNGGTVTPTDGSVTSAKLAYPFVVNEDGAAASDFRVESDSNTHMLFVDAGNDRVGIGTNSSQPFLVNGARGSGMGGYPTWETTTGRNLALFETDQSEGSFVLGSPTNGYAQLGFADPAHKASGRVGYDHNSDAMIFGTNGGTEAMRIDSTGAVTKTLQPAFNVSNSAHQTNISSGANITFDTENFDTNADFASNTFTAPVTGKYQLNLQLRLGEIDSAAAYVFVQIETSNRAYQAIFDPRQFNGDLTYFYMSINAVADMDANDTADVHFYQSGGTTQVDTDYGGTNFSGCLLA
jgi:hypothetical protein